jgi:protein involved in polysaccharide export with SLBB domain
MIKCYLAIYAILISLTVSSCGKILEPVLLLSDGSEKKETFLQEQNDIKIKSLNFKNSNIANKAPYLRKVMLSGNGRAANVFNEANFLKASLPDKSNKQDYILGLNDGLGFYYSHEFLDLPIVWPTTSRTTEYRLGAGDELTFVQILDYSQPSISLSQDGNIIDSTPVNDVMLETKGIIGSNGNILLLGIGNIKASNRTLSEVQTEVRNILIRNGNTPNFQLEITKFNSKKAYINIKNSKSSVLVINNIPATLKETALNAGLTESLENFAIIKMTRNEKEYRLTARQLFQSSSPDIFIQDKDQIEVEISKNTVTKIETIVDSNGNVILPLIGKMRVYGKTLIDIQKEIEEYFIKKGLKPSFQLELIKFKSKKVFLVSKNNGSMVLPLSNSEISLKELLLQQKSIITSSVGLSLIKIIRDGETYQITGEQLLKSDTPDIFLQDQDQIELESLPYKPGQVFALSGTKSADVIPINPSKRETLADILFVPGGALSNISAKRSEVYLLRGRKPVTAFHLDAQDVSRVLVAANTELRPNDIIFVAERPIISFSRVLSEINPLRVLLRDIENNNLP